MTTWSNRRPLTGGILLALVALGVRADHNCAHLRSIDEGGDLARIAVTREFHLVDSGEWTEQYLRLNVLDDHGPRRTVDEIMEDANRTGARIDAVDGVACFHTGFVFNQDDRQTCWRPQGLTGSADAFPDSEGKTPAGRKLLVVSWYDGKCTWSPRKGARVTFVDVTSMSDIRYRHVLLVEPTENDAGLTTFRTVERHAGGIAWVGRYVYMADTHGGFRVFDTEFMLRANTTDPGAASRIGLVGGELYAYDYKYVLPQVGRYRACNDCDMLFSWMSLDRSASPPRLLSGEYRDSANGRMFQWPLAADGRLADGPTGAIVPSEAFFLAQRKVQGGLSRSSGSTTRFLLIGKRGDQAKLFRKRPDGGSSTTDWIDDNTAQNLHHSPFSDNLWNLAEFRSRPVWACKLADVE